MIERLWQQTQRLAAWFVIAAGGMLLAAAIIVTVEVLLRKGFAAVFGWSIVFSGSDEISAYLFAVATAWSLPYALVHRGHIGSMSSTVDLAIAGVACLICLHS